jgi:hypothetical protein
MSAKDTYKSWKTTLTGIVIQGAVLYSWINGVQPIDMFSVLVFVGAFALWLMPDAFIERLKNHFDKQQNL